MSDIFWTQLFLAITTITTLYVTISNAKKASEAATKESEAAKKAAEAAAIDRVNADRKTDTLIEKSAEIHAATNGNLHKLTEEVGVLNAKLEGMQKLNSSLVAGIKATDKAADASERRVSEALETPPPEEPCP